MDVSSEILIMLLAAVFVAAPFVVVLGGTSGRFWSAVRRRPARALSFFEADDAWIVLRDEESVEELPDGLEGPYLLDLPDGTDRVVYGRGEDMKRSMHRYLRSMP